VPQRLTFAQYLVGHASLERPPFFYAYAGLWLHLLVGTAFLLLFTEISLFTTLTSMVVGSFCMGIIIYGVLSREYGLLLNLLSYASSMGKIVYSQHLGAVFPILSLILALVSGYFLLSREYKHYNRDVFNDRETSIPGWITITMSTVVVLLCIFGLTSV